MQQNLSQLRKRGLIPARQHDAFLLALLLAVLFNLLFFAVQALLPRIVMLISILGTNPSAVKAEEEIVPFVLVDPSLIDEIDPDEPYEAEGNVSRLARQVEDTPDLPEDTAYVPEGIDVLLSAPPGSPGPVVPEGNADENVPGEESQETSMEEIPPLEQSPSPQPPAETPPPPEMPPEPQPEMIEKPPEQPVETFPDILPEQILAALEPPVETVSEPMPEAAIEPIVEPVQPAFTDERPVVEDAEMSELIDLAMLPPSTDGFMPHARSIPEPMERRERQEPPRAVEMPEERREPVFAAPPAVALSEISDASRQPQASQTPRRAAPPIKKIGQESSAAGAAPRRSTQSRVRLLGTDASMRILQHRYGEYMKQVQEKLQASLNRQAVLMPTGLSRGEVKIRFGISPDGSLTYFETVYAREGMVAERLMSEQTVVEAGPFDPLTPEMQRDEHFQNLTVVVHLM